MTAITAFTNTEFGEVRTMMREGEPWFVAADVCRALEIGNPSDAMRRLDEDEKALVSIEGMSRGNDITNIINEAGLYALVLGSRKPEAKAFKRWITHEVIPTIRKHGAYITAETAERLMADPDFQIKLLTRLRDEQEGRRIAEAKVEKLEADNVKLSDAVDELDKQVVKLSESRDYFEKHYREYRIKNYFTDFCMEHGENLSIRDTAKELGVKETEFTKLLVDKKYLYRRPNKQNRLFPYSTPKCNGVFVVKEYQLSGGLTYQTQTLVTPAGRAKLTAECVKAGLLPMALEAPAFAWEV